MKNNYELGTRLRDTVTGFEGVAVARVEYINGCTQFGLAPPVSEGKVLPVEYFDWQRLEPVLDEHGFECRLVLPASPTGGPQRDVPR